MEEQLQRLIEGQINMTEAEQLKYLAAPDILPYCTKNDVPLGYKLCTKCKKVLKLYLFNRNSSVKINCAGNCKECQKKASAVSYTKNKGSRNWKAYYQDNKEAKQEQARTYYKENKEALTIKHRLYRQTAQGRANMQKAHDKRKQTMLANRGIPYTRELIIDRDKVGEYPICYMCGQPIVDEKDIHLEHVIPIVVGGPDCFTNVACAHQLCNLTKTKDAREISPQTVDDIKARAEAYIDKNAKVFESLQWED